jgi:hypothetical protein
MQRSPRWPHAMVGRCDEPSSPRRATQRDPSGAPLFIIESGPITHAQVCLHHSRCSYTDSLRRRAKRLSSLKTGTAPILTWQFASAPRPTPCESTYAGAVSHPWRSSSTPVWKGSFFLSQRLENFCASSTVGPACGLERTGAPARARRRRRSWDAPSTTRAGGRASPVTT